MWGGGRLPRFLPDVGREHVLLVPENAVFISLGQSCVFSCPSTFGLQSSLCLESPDFPSAPTPAPGSSPHHSMPTPTQYRFLLAVQALSGLF